MNDKPIHRSATLEQKIESERAADQAERRGIARGIEMVAAWLELKQEQSLADELRSAKVIERTDE
jgi:hypothetical protein